MIRWLMGLFQSARTRGHNSPAINVNGGNAIVSYGEPATQAEIRHAIQVKEHETTQIKIDSLEKNIEKIDSNLNTKLQEVDKKTLYRADLQTKITHTFEFNSDILPQAAAEIDALAKRLKYKK